MPSYRPTPAVATLVELLHERASQRPDHVLYTFHESEEQQRSLTYAGLKAQARRIAAGLQAHAAPSERALLLYPPGLDYVAGFFGCLAAGMVAVPAYPPDPMRLERTLPRLLALVRDAGTSLALTTSDLLPMAELLAEQAPELRALRWVATDALPAGSESAWRQPPVGAESLAFLQYTSGSTGTPKGVMLSHRNLLHNLELISRAFELGEGDPGGVIWLPPYHDMGLIGGLLVPLYHGFPVDLLSPLSFLERPLRWLELLSRTGASVSGGPNFAYELCVRKSTPAQREALNLRAWEVAFCGAEPIRPETLERFAQAFAVSGFRRTAFYPCYGLAEATLIVSGGLRADPPALHGLDPLALERGRAVTTPPGTAGSRTLVGCGLALGEQRIAIVDPETSAPCPPDAVGEIWVQGASVAQGYWHRLEETAHTFQARTTDGRGPWLRTGDLGWLREDGQLFVTGRLKDLIILRGRNHYPQDIERTSELSHPALRPGCGAAFSIEVEGEERLALVQELDTRRAVDAEEVAAAIRQRVAEVHEVQLHTLVLIEPGSLPKTSSGKVQRRAAREALLAGTLRAVYAWSLSSAPRPEAPPSTSAPDPAPTPIPSRSEDVEAWLRATLAARAGIRVEELPRDAPITRYGLDSLAAVELTHELQQRWGATVPMEVLLRGPSAAELAAQLRSRRGDAPAPPGPAPATRPAALPLSSAQRRLWFLDQLTSASPLYNLPAAIRLEGSLDTAALARSLLDLVRRHEALRTTFPAEQGRPVQAVHPPPETPFLAVVDLQHVPAEQRDAEALRLATHEARRPFDLSRDQLLRATLLRLGPQSHVLLVTMHHIVSDGWSIDVLARELSTLYAALRTGQPSPLPALPLQYADFTLWQEAHPHSPDLEAGLAWWRQQLEGAPSALELPTDHPRPALPSLRGARATTLLPAPLWIAVQQLARREHATPFMVLLAAFQALLFRWSGQTDVSVGTPAAGRAHAALEGLIGFFANTLVLRTRLSPADSFVGLLERVRASTLAAYARQDVPFERLVDALQPERVLGRTPLFQVALVLQRDYAQHLSLHGLTAEVLDVHPGTALFDLTLTLTERREGLAAALEYSTDLFEHDTAERMLGHLSTLLSGALEDPTRRLWELPLLTGSERHHLLHELNPPRATFQSDGTLHGHFEAQAERTPDRVALTCESRHLTYRELNQRANRLAHRLRALGVGPEVRVGLCLERSEELIVALIAVLKAGGAYVPVDPSYPEERRAFMLEDAGARILVNRELLAEDVSGLPDSNLDSGTTADHLAYVIYTSGSTGRPKGALLCHAQVLRLFAATRRWFDFGPEDVWTLFHSYAFDFSVWEIWGALLHGGRLVVVPHAVTRSPAAFHALLRDEGVTVLNQTPSAFHQLISADEQSGPPGALRLRYVIFGGEALDFASLKPWFSRHGDARPLLVNMYGITETTVHVTYRPVRAAEADGITTSAIGVPLPDLRIYVLDPWGQPVPVGVPGELYVGGDGLGRGYLGRPELTAERFVPDPFSDRPGARLYRSGDLARFRASGELEYLGRIDHQVKVRGFRIELGEVESSLSQLPSVREAAVMAYADEPGLARLVAYVVPRDPSRFSGRELREHLKSRLPEYMVPSTFLPLEVLPLTPTGKLDRRALPKPEAIRDEGALPYAEPSTPLERQVARAWAATLGVERVGREDHFFNDLGGTSLQVVRACAVLRDELHRDVPVTWLFERPTLRGFAQRLEEGAPTSSRPAAQSRPSSSRPPAAGSGAIAIIGMAGRLPGASDLTAFWRNLTEGRESISRFDPEELEPSPLLPPGARQSPRFVPAGGVLEGADRFDARFFDLSPREAQWMDPQQRLLLQVAWSALEDAGYVPDHVPGAISLYAGAPATTPHLLALLQHAQQDPATLFEAVATSGAESLATKAAFKLKLRGESVHVYTACSTGLVAVHLACQSLLSGRSELALAGGVRISLPQRTGYLHQDGMIFSPDGHCRAFDARAGGTVVGNGVAVVVLKRLEDALEDGDHVYAVIQGSAVNNDGDQKSSYTAPSVEGQAEVITQALAHANLRPRDISYVEAHGTGTLLGDPIEVSALNRAFGGRSAAPRSCALGSVKTNVGHLDTAAGLAGLMKVALALHHEQLPPSLNFERPNPEIDFEGGPFFVNTALREWKRGEVPRRAGVSSFGIGGTNAHAILEEAPPTVGQPSRRPRQLVTLSARSPEALEAQARELASWLEANTSADLADVAFTRNVGRKAFEHRRALVAADTASLAKLSRNAPTRASASTTAPRAAFLFPGQGAQAPGMARELYEVEPSFRQRLDPCLEALRPLLGEDLRAHLFPEHEAGDPLALIRPRLGLPALFAVEYALAGLWMDWGVKPRALLGHSYGEYVAACLAGVLPLESALRLAVIRGQLMERLPEGGMVAVALPEEEVRSLCKGRLALAAVNGAERCVVSGPLAELEALEQELARRAVGRVRLPAPHAFHSADVEPLMAELSQAVASLQPRAPSLPYVSSLTGTWIRPEEVVDPRYWALQMRQPVLFARGLDTLAQSGCNLFIEAGPGHALTSLVRAHLGTRAAVPSLRREGTRQSDHEALLQALGAAWSVGVEVDWKAFYAHERRRRISLPTYPFQEQRFTLEVQSALPALATAPAPEQPRATPAAPELPSRPVVPTGSPRAWIEERITALWHERLGRTDFGPHDNFLELGGNSLMAAQLLTRLRDTFGVPLPLQDLFEAPTVAGLAARIEALLQDVRPDASSAGGAALVRIDRGGPLPLSIVQERLWRLAQLEPENPLFNEPLAVRLEGPVDAGLLERCLQEACRRHESLRMTFPSVNGAPAPRLHDQVRVPLELVDLRPLGAERHAEAVRRARQEAARPLSLDRLPLVRTTLLRLDEREHVLLITVHHIVADTLSLVTLLRDVGALYRAALEGRPARLPDLPVQYVDFAAWQRRALEDGTLGAQQAWWRQRLAHLPASLALPTDRPPPAVERLGGARLPVAFSRELTEALRALGQREGVTLFVTVLAAFQALLSRYGSQQDVVIGTSVANRTRSELEPLIGYTAHALALRADLSGDPTFRELLARARAAVLEASAHEDVPFEQLVHELQPARAPGRMRLFDALLIFHAAEAASDNLLPGVRIEPLEVPDLPAQYGTTLAGISLLLRDGPKGLGGVIEYATELYDAPRMERLARDLEELLSAAVTRADAPLSQLPPEPLAPRSPAQAGHASTASVRPLAFSLSYFADDESAPGQGRYQLLIEGARFADENGFSAVWTPERHFHSFGGLYPNPSITSAAVAAVTRNIHVRAGSVVLPLHDPIRVAEDWSMIDNLSAGRVGIAAASGWNARDFIFAPDDFAQRKDVMLRALETVRTLWRGGTVRRRNGNGEDVDISLRPRPVQHELPVWLTAAGNPETYRLAGELGVGVLTNLMGKTLEQVATHIQVYREAWRKHGHPGEGHVTLMLHAFLGHSREAVRKVVREPLLRYFRSSIDILRPMLALQGFKADLEQLTERDQQSLLEHGFDRYFDTAGLFGTPEDCLRMVDRVRAIEVDEIACLIDFGVELETVMGSLRQLAVLRERSQHGARQTPPAQAPAPVIRPAAALSRGGPRSAESVPPLVPVPRAQPLPLSFSQQSLWYQDRTFPGSVAYNIPITLRLTGRLQAEALERSLDELVRRHEVLRTRYEATGSGPVQRIDPARATRLEVLDVSEAGLDAKLEELAWQPFELSRGPMLRAWLLRLSADEHVLLLVLHHIAADGWSAGVLSRELGLLYLAAASGRQASLPPLPVQYADFALWQRRWLEGPWLDEERAWWRRQLAGTDGVLELPTDRPRPNRPSLKGSSLLVHLPAALSESLKALARREGATPFMVLLTGLYALLYRYSGQEDIVVGSPVAGRNRPETEPLIGCFVNTLPLRAELSGNPTLRALLGRVRALALGAFAHQELPFERLVEELHLRREMGRTPLVQVIFTLQNAPMGPLALPGLTLRPMRVRSREVKFDLTLDLADSPEGFTGIFEYSTELFEERTAQRMLVHFQRLLEALVAEPHARLADTSLLGEQERRQVLLEWNSTEAPFSHEATLASLFRARAARSPEAVALLHGDRLVTYAELEQRTHPLAWHLRSLGVGPEVRVGVCMKRSPDMVVALLAILEAGGAFLPLEPTHPLERLAFMLEDSGAALVLTQRALRERLPTGARVLCVDELPPELASQPREAPPLLARAENLAYVLYTSGSTGRPKGVLAPHRGTVNRLEWMWRTWPFRPGERCCQKTALSFGDSLWEIFGPLLAGVPAVLVPEETVKEPRALVELLARAGVTRLVLVPALLESLLEADGVAERLSRLWLWVTSGERLPADLARRFRERMPGATLLNLYGSSEVAADATEAVVGEGPVTIGRPLANTRVYVLNAALQPQPVGLAGELYVGGEGLARGYLGQPAFTAERFVPDPFSATPGARLYRTGDVARWREDGRLEYVGRTDFQVKVRGFRIELGEVESALRQHPEVHEAAVALRADAPGGTGLVAYAVPAAGKSLAAQALRSFLRDRLPAHMVPAAFVVLDALPKTSGGKVDRRALPAPSSAPAGATANTRARTSTETALGAIWAEVLGLKEVGVEDDFFALGGHSLLATRVLARVGAAFGVDLPMRVLFESPTLEGLARALDAAVKSTRAASVPPLVPVPRTAELPLSFSQQRLWFLDQLDPGNPVYNIPGAVKLIGALDLPALERSLQELVRRHEALRTRFRGEDGHPRQAISPPGPMRLEAVDLRPLPPDRREPELQRRLAAEADRPFDLANDLLLRATLFALDEREHVLALTMHHIVSDGWSMGVLIEDLSALYLAFSSGKPSPLPDLPIQYADYAVWQRQWVSGAVLAEQLAWWRRQLAGAPPALDLPTDFPRPEVQRFRGATVTSTLPAPLSARLRTLATQEGATPFMVLLAAFQVLLSRYSGQDDLCVGSPIAGRRHTLLEHLIGFFVNTLVLRTRLSGDPSFRELLSRVRETTLDTFAHQELPFEKLVEELAPVRHSNRSPLFQVAFVLQNTAAGTLASTPRLKVELMPTAARTAKFDLTLALSETPDGFSAQLEYDADLFREDTARRMLEHFQVLLEGATVRPDQRISRLPLLSDAERRRVLAEWNDTATDYPRDATVHALFAAQAARAPEAIAVELDGQVLTYSALLERSRRLAHHLIALDVRPGDRVALCLQRSFDMVAALLAVLEAGATYVPLEPSYPRERLALILEDASCPLVLTHEALLSTVPPGPRVVVLDTLGPVLAGMPTTAPERFAAADAPAYVMFTSGSTGRPKGVCVPHRGIVRLVKGARYADFGPDTVFAHAAPIAFDASTFELWGALLNGGRVVLLPDGAPSLAELASFVKQHGIDTLWLTSALFEQMAAAYPEVLASVRQVLAGGDVLSPARVQHLLGLGAHITNAYGPTEGTTFTTCCRMSSPDEVGTTVSIGRPISNTRVYLLDAQLSPVPIGVPGELYIAGDGLASGYLNRPELTAERFLPDPFSPQPGGRLYRSGDLARFLPDGRIEFVGRRDAQVKIRGFRVEPGEVEAALTAHASVREAAVVAREGPGGKRLVAYVVASGTVEPSSLKEYLARRLPQYMVPSAIVLLDALPLTPSGKVDRKALPDAEPQAIRQEYVAPSTPLEQQLAEIWRSLLGVERVGARDNFFDLGGHSLLATQLVMRISGAFGMELPLRVLFQSPTVAQLAARIEALRRKAEAPAREKAEHTGPPPLVRAPRDHELPLTFSQERLWRLYQRVPESTAYNMAAALRIRGPLDAKALERAFQQLVRRHESLRTTFTESQGRPVQRVSPSVDFTLPVVDVGPGAEEGLAHRIGAEARTPFDLERGPVLRGQLLRLSAHDHLLLFSNHHIVSDGWSQAVLVRELSAIYAALVTGREPALPPLPVQFPDYAVWQRGWLQGRVLEERLGWWCEQLRGAPVLLNLPLSRPRPAERTFEGGEVPVRLGPARTRALHALCREEGLTPFMLLLASFGTVLAHHAAQEEVVIGSPVANRPLLELEGLIGLFVNGLALRVDLRGNPSFRALLRRVKDVTLGAYAHQDVPFEKVVDAMGVERLPNRTPVFQAMLDVQNAPSAPLRMPGLTFTPEPIDRGTTAYEVTLAMQEGPDGYGGALEYNRDLYEGPLPGRMAADLLRLLERVLANPELPVGLGSEVLGDR